MKDIKIYPPKFLENEDKKKQNILVAREILNKIMQAGDYESAMNSYIELFYICGKNKKKLEAFLNLPINTFFYMPTQDYLIKDMPIIQEISKNFNPQNILQVDAIVGLDEIGRNPREQAIYEPQVFYLPCEGMKDEEILYTYKEKRDLYNQINHAIMIKDTDFLTENIEFIESMPCYHWCLSHFNLKNKHFVLQKERKE